MAPQLAYKKANAQTSHSTFIQPKLMVNAPNDVYEQEADAMADSVMRMSSNEAVKPVASLIGKSLQRKCTHCEEEEKKPVMRKAEAGNSGMSVSYSFAASLNASKGGGAPLPQGTRSFMENAFSTDFSGINIHTDKQALKMSQSINAKAFTYGSDIYFGAGEYSPDTHRGKSLLAHELTHVLQQSMNIQRQVVNMPAQNVTVGMPKASDLQQLTGQLNNPGFSASYSQSQIDLNSPIPTTILPFTATGWNGSEIATKLGQHDRLQVTDSDAFRCVQTVALMSHILQGPLAVFSYLSSIKLQSLFANPGITPRMRVAWQVIEYVKTCIQSQQATYGDMAQMIEAIHALFYKDDAGTPRSQINDQVNPMLDLSSNMQTMDVWCSTPADLLARANTLQNGEQFLLNTWNVSFNANFDLAEGGDTDISHARSARVGILDENTGRTRNVTIRRIDATHRPDSSRIDRNRDTMSGHQMLIYKDVATGHVMMYEPELTTSGNHLFDITNDATPLTDLFSEQPAFELYHYVQLLGKITPTPMSSVFSITP